MDKNLYICRNRIIINRKPFSSMSIRNKLIFTFLVVPFIVIAQISENKPAIEPLLKSEWGQQAPFNYSTPIIDGTHAKTGCVATALAQVIYFYRHPERGKRGVYTNTGSTGDFSFDFASNTFDYDLMKDKYDTTTPDTDASALEVSKLMLAAGVTVDMNYGISSSSGTFSRIPTALSEWYLYPSDGMGQLSKECFTTEEWGDVIYEELAAGRPVLYLGGNGISSHVFVCDGYRDGKFHMNWGWYGEKNGYFSLANLQTERVGDGSILSLNSSQRIVRGVRLDGQATPGPLATASAFGYELASDKFSVINISCFSDNTRIIPGVKVIDTSGNTVTTLWASAEATVNRKNSNLEFGVDMSEIADGSYLLRPVYRLASDPAETSVINNIYCNIQNTRYYSVEITGHRIVMAEGETDMEVNVGISEYYQYSSFIKNERYNVGFSVLAENTGNTNITRFGVKLCQPGETEAIKYTAYAESLAPGEAKTVPLGLPTVDPGEYDMIIYDNNTKTHFGEPIRIIIHDSKKITTVENSTFRYMPLSEDTKEATILAPALSSAAEGEPVNIAIDPVVTLNGTEYKITEIGPRLLYGRSDVSGITISANVNKIAPGAFSGCTNLSEITVNAVEPPVIHPSAFDSQTISSAKITVPQQSIELYRQAPVWSGFVYDDNNTDEPGDTGPGTLTMQSFAITPGENGVTTMTLVTEKDYFGCQFTLTLPDGLFLSSDGITVAEDLKANNFSIGTSAVSDENSYTVVMFSIDNATYPKGSTPILDLQLSASRDFEGGEILLTDVKFSEAGENKSDRDVNFPDSQCVVTANGMSWVDEIAIDETLAADVYDISGIMLGKKVNVEKFMPTLSPGLYIVKSANKTYKLLKR